MPTRKRRLSRAEQAEFYAQLRQLQTEGVDVYVFDELQES
jgi:hypothetical protein